MPSSKHIWYVPAMRGNGPWHFKRADGLEGRTDSRAEARKLRAQSIHEAKMAKRDGAQLGEQEE